MSRSIRRGIALLACIGLAAALSACGGGGSSGPPAGSSQLVSVPATDALLSPDGPLNAEQVYALDPGAVTQAFDLSPDPTAQQELVKLQDSLSSQPKALQARAMVPRLELAGPAQTYTYLYCYGTAWLLSGTQRLPLNTGSGDNFYLSGWGMQPGAGGKPIYIKVPVQVPSSSALTPVDRHLVYYSTQYSPGQLDAMCQSSLMADARLLSARTYPFVNGTVQLSDITPRGRNNSLSDDHPFLPANGSVGDGRIHTLVSFGDSLSDTDATSNMMFHILPNRKTWFAGDFTDGWVWAEYAAQDLGITPYNEAWGAAGAAPQAIVRSFPGAGWLARAGVGFYFPSIVQQAGLYDKRVVQILPRNPDETLYSVLIGGNDFVNYDEPVSTVLSGMAATLQALIQTDGAKNIVVMNLPDVTAAPVFLQTKAAIKAQVEAKLNQYDAALPALVAQISAQYPQVNLHLFDTRAVFDQVLQNPQAYGFIDSTDPCLGAGASSYSSTVAMRPTCNGYNYVFWDTLHPTTAVHKILGDSFAAFARQYYRF